MNGKLERLGKKVASWCWKVIKRRLAPDHVLFEEGDLYCCLAAKYLPLDSRDVVVSRVVEFPCGLKGCSMVFDSLLKYEAHYNTCHRNVCQQCRRIFPSAHLLDVHLLEVHDVMFTLMAEKQNMFQCLVEDCPLKFKASTERRQHLIKVHKYPSSFRYDKRTQKTPKKKGKAADEAVTEAMETGGPVKHQCVDSRTDVGDKTQSPGSATGRVFSYKVPKEICFGQGVSRGFSRGRGRGRGKKKHWHNKGTETMDTAVNIETVDMKDLAEALN